MFTGSCCVKKLKNLLLTLGGCLISLRVDEIISCNDLNNLNHVIFVVLWSSGRHLALGSEGPGFES